MLNTLGRLALLVIVLPMSSVVLGQSIDQPEGWGPAGREGRGEAPVPDAAPRPALEVLLSQPEREASRRLDDALANLVLGDLQAPSRLHSVADYRLAGGARFGDFFQVSEDMPIVDFTVIGNLAAAQAHLERLFGVEILASASTPAYHLISARVPVALLLDAAGMPDLRSANAAGATAGGAGETAAERRSAQRSGLRSQGNANNQAETTLEVEAVRRVLPAIDGSGISVGTISDSVSQVGGGIGASQASGDLPANARINVVQDWANNNPTDEGRAMMEHIYDIAPQVQSLGFATGSGGQANFANNIAALGAAGMDIINDDLVYFAEPFFQDGVVAQAVNTYIIGGGIYFSLNHNFANLSNEGVWNNPDEDVYHGFSGNDELLQVTVAGGTVQNPANTILVLQWAEPWGAATVDLDLELWDNGNPRTLLQSSTNANIGGNPFEQISISNTGAAYTAHIAVRRVSGNPDGLTLKIVAHANGTWQLSIDEYPEQAAGTLTPHAGTSRSIAIGAAPFFNRDTAESFSGRGPHRRFFDAAGNPVGPLTFTKPDFTSIDNANTTFFGRDIAQDDDVLPNFSGTSAATPNAAAVAALMLQATGGPGSLSQEDIRRIMRLSAIDLGDAGHDITYGHGRINALGAVIGASGPRNPEYTLYLNAFGDAFFSQNLFAITDIDRIEFATNITGDCAVSISDGDHPNMDPMLALFYQVLDAFIGLDYSSGFIDDALIDEAVLGNVPITAEVLSETAFAGDAVDFDMAIDCPTQNQSDRTLELDPDGNDLAVPGKLVWIGESDFYRYTAPDAVSLSVTLDPEFKARLMVYDQFGERLNTRLIEAGASGGLGVSGISPGEDYLIQVVSDSYAHTGDYLMSVRFGGDALFSDRFE